jgi:hypothetical protein
MPQISNRVLKGALGAIALSLTLGAMTLGAIPLALGRDLSARDLSADNGATEATVNRDAKTDRAMRVAAPGPTQTISLRLAGLSDTSVLVRIPLVREARDNSPPRPVLKLGDRKLAVACEPVVSVLTEVAKQLQPGRCVT